MRESDGVGGVHDRIRKLLDPETQRIQPNHDCSRLNK